MADKGIGFGSPPQLITIAAESNLSIWRERVCKSICLLNINRLSQYTLVVWLIILQMVIVHLLNTYVHNFRVASLIPSFSLFSIFLSRSFSRSDCVTWSFVWFCHAIAFKIQSSTLLVCFHFKFNNLSISIFNWNVISPNEKKTAAVK